MVKLRIWPGCGVSAVGVEVAVVLPFQRLLSMLVRADRSRAGAVVVASAAGASGRVQVARMPSPSSIVAVLLVMVMMRPVTLSPA